MKLDPEEVVRAFFACYSNGQPDGFNDLVAEDYLDYGHEPPGRGPQGACADYEQAKAQAGGITHYTIDALVPDGDAVAVVWTGHLPNGSSARGLSLYQVREGLLRSTRHAHLQS